MAFNKTSARPILAEALHKANNAVIFDYRQNFGEAIRSYGDSCSLLGQVMRFGLDDEDGRRLEAIRTTYVRRIYELQGYVTPSMHGL